MFDHIICCNFCPGEGLCLTPEWQRRGWAVISYLCTLFGKWACRDPLVHNTTEQMFMGKALKKNSMKGMWTLLPVKALLGHLRWKLTFFPFYIDLEIQESRSCRKPFLWALRTRLSLWQQSTHFLTSKGAGMECF